jgi:cytochrome c553
MGHKTVAGAAARLGGLLLAVGASASAAAADDKQQAKQLAYGKYLSSQCTSCHRLDGADKGIPSIVGIEADVFVETMKFYQSGARDNPAMVSIAQMLGEDQLKALAAYFGSLKSAGKGSAKR